MEDQRKGFITWVKAHKKELIIAGISVAALIGVILCIKNRETIEILWKSLCRDIDKSPVKVLEVSQTTIEKITQSSVIVTDFINSNEIPVINMALTIQNPFEVNGHIRNLHKGFRASAKKIIEAKALGIILQPGQTLVNAYMKGCIAA